MELYLFTPKEVLEKRAEELQKIIIKNQDYIDYALYEFENALIDGYDNPIVKSMFSVMNIKIDDLLSAIDDDQCSYYRMTGEDPENTIMRSMDRFNEAEIGRRMDVIEKALEKEG